MFKRKHEFKPDKTNTGMLSKLYVTKRQRQTIFKWLLMALVLVVLSVIQDVILCRVRIFGSSLNLVTAALLLVCVLQDPEIGSVFILIGSTLYWASGSTPGSYVIALLTVLGILICILRQSYLYDHAGSMLLCAGGAVMLYELTLFAIGCFFGHTTLSRFPDTLISGGLSFAVMPLLYPVFKAISKIGGETWKD